MQPDAAIGAGADQAPARTMPPMTPQDLLAHLDAASFWPADHGVAADGDLDRAYATALAVRALREARGERVAGYKLGWTNRANWPRQGVRAPMWGTLHETSVVHCADACEIDLAWTTLPRLEPEIVVAFGAAPADAGADALFACLDWIAPGFEVVQSHLPGWGYTPAQVLADSAVHAKLVVGRRTPVRALAPDAATLSALLARGRVTLREGGRPRGEGRGEIVLGSPFEALRTFVAQLAERPGATPLRAGDLVTTGTWTNAFDLAPGERWRAEFDFGVAPLEVGWR